MTISSVTLKPDAATPSGSTRDLVPAARTTPGLAAQKSPLTEASVVTYAPSPERVTQALKQINDAFTQKEQNLYALFEQDKTTGISVVKVLDKNTHEEVSQYPAKEIVAFAEAMIQSIEGKGQLLHVSA